MQPKQPKPPKIDSEQALFIDALRVYNQTGLTPRELVNIIHGLMTDYAKTLVKAKAAIAAAENPLEKGGKS